MSVSTPLRPLVPRAAEELVASARRSLAEASLAASAHERYAAAHLAALRAAAAVLAARGRPAGTRSRVVSVWVLLPRCAPELGEWATFFAAGSRKRASAEAGISCVSVREADDLVRDAGTFISRVCDLLGIPEQTVLGSTLLHVG
ncbi:MAG: SAV_6107 family HEPN domain-containing protein [Candidatus Nanopelagicales bacterium]|jgi:hypothetical protein|nr:hypothetical protein [Candidatus Nanopelagicales bacterium]MCF8536288.1 hypothetical protein [Candidatus Nanopelagicales bacterium]MCF8541443.1 hypothetical protein [Candidatus Nanopelagicales bacterium]MCF8556085.1 hypothetical protein [Candidatus Nanopelagicales bacterium]MDA2986407.1 SAV_6107 family HEPN domain-containing protein [Actinomycetota bacterium]